MRAHAKSAKIVAEKISSVKTACTLIIDTRERNVLRHAKELEEITYEVKQITTADYVVTYGNIIIAAIERKSLEDYAASIKDGRADNKKKLIELRQKTNCALIYIIEGDPFPRPDDCYGNIPYRYIESSIFHLMVRDKITVMRTADTLGTAATLVRFVKSMDRLSEKHEFTEDATTDIPIAGGIESLPLDLNAELTRRHVRSDHEMVRELWSCFPGISVETADEYSKVWSIADIVCEHVPRAAITNFKMASGRKISKRVVNSLMGITNPIACRLLSCVEGISVATAHELIAERSLKALLGYGVVGISMCKIGKTKRALGDERATRLLRLFNYKYVPGQNAVVPAVPAIPAPAVPAIPVPAVPTPKAPTPKAPVPAVPTPKAPEIIIGAEELNEINNFLGGL
jgi:ERCC4-type nuclease